LTVIVILALVALFIGLRLYSVLGERTGHEQQPILKPADPDARIEPRTTTTTVVQPTAADPGDMAFLPTAGPVCEPFSRPTRRSTSRASSKARKRRTG
jgi:hypothetical protein